MCILQDMKNIHFRTYRVKLPQPENNWRDRLSRWFLIGIRNEDLSGDGKWQIFTIFFSRAFSIEYDYWIMESPEWSPLREWRFPSVFHVSVGKETKVFYQTKFGFGKRAQ